MVVLLNGGQCDENSRKRRLEGGYCKPSGVPLGYKPRKVSCVRDYPPGCGWYAPPIHSPETAVAWVGDEDKVVDGGGTAEVVVADCVGDSWVGGEIQSHELVRSPVVSEMTELSDDLVRKLGVMAGMVSGDEKFLADVEPLAKDLDHVAPEKKTDMQFCSLADGTIPVYDAKVWSAPQWPVSNGSVSGKIAPKSRYARRRVSAARDYPPYCGRNAPLLTEDDRRRAILTENLDFRKRAGIEGRPSRETMQAGADRPMMCASIEEMERDATWRNAAKSKLKGTVLDLKNNSEIVNRKDKGQVGGFNGKFGREKFVLAHDKILDGKPANNPIGLACEMNRVLVASKTSSHGGVNGIKVKRHDLFGRERSKIVTSKKDYLANYSGGKYMEEESINDGKAVYEGIDAPTVSDEEGSFSHDGKQLKDSDAFQRLHDFDVNLPPFGPNNFIHGNARNKVRATLRLFQAICRKLLQGEEEKFSQEGEARLTRRGNPRRIDLEAIKIVKCKGKEVNAGHILGAVPGVEVGDEFQYRVELALIGVHRLYQGGIDYMKHGGAIVATSIVASGGYADDLDNADYLIYCGQGGHPRGNDKKPEDQKLQRGNLALKNSIASKNPVRVIRGSKEAKALDSSDARDKIVMTYTYDGLYTVERYWQECGAHGKKVFMFELRRIPGQPELAWKELKHSEKHSARKGLCVDDISGGKERLPICAVNSIDSEKPLAFTYIKRMIYPKWCDPSSRNGCDCTGLCLDPQKCSCAFKNGGTIPYNHDGAIVEVKPLVYECGPSCKCPPSCYNRISQQGIKIPLEIFKTDSRGWGVRSIRSISSGSFICEYTGELLEDMEAEKRTGNDEYLFDIGQNYNHFSNEIMEDGGYTIDAAIFGNVGRFINHSCSPNLYAQNVLYDHEDKRMPHIMLFAAENIPPLRELTYHYNYSVNQICDSNGNIKMKSCFCGSTGCIGRMY